MDAKLKNKLDMLLFHYTKSLPEKIASIEQQWSLLLTSWDLARFEVFHRDVHSLCGSSGTYGYHELSKAARTLEVFLKGLLKREEAVSSEQQETIETYIEALKAVLFVRSDDRLEVFKSSDNAVAAEDKLIYIIEEDKALVDELIQGLTHAGYQAFWIKDSDTLTLAIQEKPPIAIIHDTDCIKKTGISELLQIQQEDGVNLQLFCIIPTSGLQPRLDAIRAGCTAFFQKPVDVFELTQTLNQKCSPNAESYRVLVMDDSESLGEYYCIILGQAGFLAQNIFDPMDLLDKMDSFCPDLLLMDLYMPACSGLELAVILRQEPRYTKIPIIFLSTEDDSRTKLSAISMGGDDFLTKPVSPTHLISAVRSRSQRASTLNHYMKTDSLTGLLNHSSILRQLDVELLQAKQKKLALTFIMVDIDGFKEINDTYGHPVGDIVIKKLAVLLSGRLRSQDSVGRYGGEEFAIILPGATVASAKEIIDMLRSQFSGFSFPAGKKEFSVTFSAGISGFDNDKIAKKIIAEADEALYEAKKGGRNLVLIYSS